MGSSATSSATVVAKGSNTVGRAALIVNQNESQDIFSASVSGGFRFAIQNDGDLELRNQAIISNATDGTLSLTEPTIQLVGATAIDVDSPLINLSTQATDIELKDAETSALTISLGSDNFLTFDTGDSSESLTVGNSLTNMSLVFDIGSSGNITFSDFQTDANAVLYTNTSGVLTRVAETETGSECLLSGAGASGAPSWGTCPGGGTNYWQLGTQGIAPYNLTLDTYFGGTATASAHLRVAGIETATGNVLDINSDTITSGTVADFNASAITSGEILKISTTGNTWNTGQLLEVSSTATSLTSGNLGLFDWSPSSWATASGDLVRINIGQYGDTTGNLFAIYDNSSELFSVDTAKITSALPHEFTAAGDVTIAYDLVFTNQTASNIKSYGPLTIESGESFENNNLTLKTFGTGDFVWDNDGTSIAIMTDTGQLGLGTTSPVAQLHVDTTNVATFGKAAVIINHDETQDILTASASGTTRMYLTNGGQLVLPTTGSSAGLILGDDTQLYDAGTNLLSLGTSDDLSIPGGDITGANSDSIDIAEIADATFTFIRNNSGTVTLTADNGTASTALTISSAGNGTLTLDPTGAAGMVLGSADVVSMSFTTNDDSESDFSFLGGATFNDDVTFSLAGAEDVTITNNSVGNTIDIFNIIHTNSISDADVQRVAVITNADHSANAVTEALLVLNNAETTADTVTDYLLITKATTGADTAADAIDVSDADLFNALNVGGNFVLFDGVREFSPSSGNWTLETTGGTDLIAATTTTFQINLDDTVTYTELLCHSGTDGATDVRNVGDCNVAGGGADLAEYFGSDGNLLPGDVVEIDESKPVTEVVDPRLGYMSKAYVKKSSGTNNHKIQGIVSTNPLTFILSKGAFSENENPVPIALSGRVPVKVASSSDVINVGDYLTTSSEPGRAMKAMQSGRIIGQALESWTPGKGKKSVVVFVNNTFYLADNPLNANGDILLTKDPQNPGYYQLKDTNGNLIDKLSGISSLIADSIKTGAIETGDLIVNGTNFVAQNIKVGYAEIQNLVSPTIRTQDIKPLQGQEDVAINIGDPTQPSGFGKLLVKNSQGKIVAQVDEAGNVYTEGDISARSATFSGELASDSLTTNDASIAGELRADRIVANEIVGLDAKLADIQANRISGISREEIEELLKEAESDQGLLAQSSAWSFNTATGSAALNEFALENLYVTGTAAVNTLSVTESLVLGNDLVINSTVNQLNSLTVNSIDTITAPLSIQSSASQPLYLMAGLVQIDTQGNVQITGDLAVGGSISGKSLTLNTDSNELTGFGKLLSAVNSLGEEVASISATGAAKLASLETDKISISDDPTATSSASFLGLIFTSSATAGTAKVPQGSREVIIRNPKITKDSLVFVTPTSSTLNPLFIKEQVEGEIKVGFDIPANSDVAFNWWLVELAKQANSQ